MIINRVQFQAFQTASVLGFEKVLMQHIKKYFPAQLEYSGEESMREVVRVGMQGAKNNRLTTRRDICLYLNCILVWGRSFHEDPQYPWAKHILAETQVNPTIRINSLVSKSNSLYEALYGDEDQLRQASFNLLVKDRETNYEKLRNGSLAGSFELLETLYFHKCRVIGEKNILELVDYGRHLARKNGLNKESNVLIFCMAMMLLGSGFCIDPQFKKAAETLIEDCSEDIKAKKLFNECIEYCNLTNV